MSLKIHSSSLHSACVCALLLEKSPHELTAHHHELGDAELNACQELATGEQLWFTGDDNDDLVNEFAVLDNSDQITHDTAVANIISNQGDSVTPDPCVCHMSSLDGSQPFFETGEDHSYDGIHTQEVNVAVKQCTDGSDDVTQSCQKLTKEDTDCSVVPSNSSEICSIDHDGYGLDSERELGSNHEGVILCESRHSGGENQDAGGSLMHDICSEQLDSGASEEAEVDLMCHTSTVSANGEVEKTSSYVIKDTEDDDTSPLDCENSRFKDIPVQTKAQRSQLSLDSSEMEAICSEVEQMPEDQLSSLFSCILDMTDVSKGFPTAVEFQQNSDCSDAGIYASFDGMKLHDGMELIPVEDAETDIVHNREDTETIGDRKNDFDSITIITPLSNDSELLNTSIFAHLGGMELRDDMELIPVNSEETGTVHNTPEPKTTADIDNYSNTMTTIESYINDTQAYSDESRQHVFLQLTTDGLEMYHMTSSADYKEQLESVPRDNSGLHSVEVLGACDKHEPAEPSDNGTWLLLTPEHASVDNQMSLNTNTVPDLDDQKESQYNLVLTGTEEEVCDSNNESSEATGTPDDEKGRTSTVPMSAAASVKSVEKMQNVEMVASLETTASTGLTGIVDSAISNSASQIVGSTENLEVMQRPEYENNTGCARSVYTAHSSGADLECHTGTEFSEISHMEQPLVNNEKTSSTVFYAHEDFPFSIYEQTDKLELFTADNLPPQTRRLELDDLTLTVTCFIPEENEESLLDDDDVLEDVNGYEHLETVSPSSSSKLTDNVPVTSSGTYMDNAISADKILPRRRSSEFMLMPIEETAEFTDDANADNNDSGCDKSHSLQPDDMKVELSTNEEQKIAYNINASPIVEHAHHLCHELNEKIQCGNVPAISDTAEPPGLGSSQSNMSYLGVTDDKEQITREERNSFTEHPVERSNNSVCEKHSPILMSSANQQDTVGQEVSMNKHFNEDFDAVAAYNSKAATNVKQVGYLLDDHNEHVTTSEEMTFTTNIPSQASCKDNTGTTNSDDASMPLAASGTQHSSSTYSAVKTAQSDISDLGDEHFLDINVFRQNTVQGISDVTKNTDHKYKNSEINKTAGLDVNTFSTAKTAHGDTSAVIHTTELKFNSEPYKQQDETAVQLHERPKSQSNNIHAQIDDIIHSLIHGSETTGVKQPTIDEEHPFSQMNTNNSDASHGSVSALSNMSFDFKATTEVEEPADDAVTDFESTLEQLHSTRNTAYTN